MREDLGRGDPDSGAPAEEGGTPQLVLPGLPAHPPLRGRVSRERATEPPESALSAAFAKAREREWWRLVAWQWDRNHWLCPSRTIPGDTYILAVRSGSVRKDPWWWRFTCSCPAEASGRYLACWHKAALYLRLRNDTLGRGPANGTD